MMNARTLQAPTRESLSISLTSTVERAGKLVAVRSHPQSGSPEIDSPVRESPEQRSTTRRPSNSRVQSVREVEGNDLQHVRHGVLQDLQDHSQHTMHQLYDMLAERYGILHMRNMLTTFRQKSGTQQ